MITDRIIYAGDTPLFSDFTVAQTGLMELTVSGGQFQITGQAKLVKVNKVPPAFFSDGRAEMMPDGERARVWNQDKVTKQIKDKSKRRTIVGNTTISVVAHPTKDKRYYIDLESPSDVVMLVQTRFEFVGDIVGAPPVNHTHMVVLPFIVPAGTTDLSGIPIEAIKILPGFPPEAPEWEV